MNSQPTKKPTKQQPPKIRAIFTQLLRTEKPFGNQFAKFSYHLTKYQYIAELFTNVKLRADQIPAYIRHLSDTMRRIINCDVRYRQRMDDLPCAVGCRAFGVAPLGGGWYSPNIKVACSNARVLEYICRQWCKRTTQYPHTLDIIFDKVNSARQAMPARDYSLYSYDNNITTSRHGNIIIESFYLSQPFRLEHYAVRTGFSCLSFGAACRIMRSADCHFDDLGHTNIDATNHTFIISDCFAINGMRAIQPWGHSSKPKTTPPPIKKTRHFYGTNTDRLASQYYRACKMGVVTYNAYIYGKLKAGATRL